MPVEMRKRMAGKSFITPIKSIKYMVKVTLSLMMTRLKLKIKEYQKEDKNDLLYRNCIQYYISCVYIKFS